MAKSKWPHVEANFDNIKKWCAEGLSEKQIARLLGIGKSTLERYKVEHPELVQVLNDGKQPFIEKLENALAKRALGYDYKETKEYIKNEGGKKVSYVEVTNKHQPPDVKAITILLFNKDKDDDGNTKWSLDPMKRELEKQALELRKEIESFKNF